MLGSKAALGNDPVPSRPTRTARCCAGPGRACAPGSLWLDTTNGLMAVFQCGSKALLLKENRET